MRQERIIQASIFDRFAEHEIGRELKAMSHWLDGQRELLSLVAADLRRGGVKETGRRGLPAEAVLRCALLKQYRQLSYAELAFHLQDSASFRAFARLPLSWSPKRSVLHKTIGAIRTETWERINRALLTSARAAKLEPGTMVRFDSTAVAALMHAPTDSSLLWDAVRVMVRLLKQASALPGVPMIRWRNHSRSAKQSARAIEYSRGRARKAELYRKLLAATHATLSSLRQVVQQMPPSQSNGGAAIWRTEVAHYLPLIERVIDQSERRILAGEAVSAGEKLVSLFEPHADIILKGGRDVHYGHKLTLATGKSGLILDAVVEDGNRADSECFLPMLRRHVAFYGTPRQTATDGAYASLDNLNQAKAIGVRDVAFHKKRGLAIEDMVRSRWIYRKLRNFRAGIEAGISCLKRAYGLARCTWRGLDHFKAYVWSSVVAYNLALFARLKPA